MNASYGVFGSMACAFAISTVAVSQSFSFIAFCAAMRGLATSALSFCLSAAFALSLSLSAATAAVTGSRAPPVTPARPAAARAAISTRFALFI